MEEHQHNFRNKRKSTKQPIKNLSREKKISYLRIALGLQHISTNDETCDRIIETYESILNMGDKFTIKDAVEIELYMDKKWQEFNKNNENLD